MSSENEIDFLRTKHSMLKAASEAGTYAAEKGYNPFFSWRHMVRILHVDTKQRYYRYYFVARKLFIQAYNRRKGIVYA